MNFEWPWEAGKPEREKKLEAAVKAVYTREGRYAWWAAWYASPRSKRVQMERVVFGAWSGDAP